MLDFVEEAFIVSTGVSGDGYGTVSGTTMIIYWQNETPSCPGHYKNLYQLDGDSMTWTFTGEDCLGMETGYGDAKKVANQ